MRWFESIRPSRFCDMARFCWPLSLSEPDFWSRRGFFAYILFPFSLLYLFLSFLRKILAKPITFPATVICVGNVNLGGTGKTRIVIEIAKILKKKKVDFLIISKGYGSKIKKPEIVTAKDDPALVGDEAVLLASYGTVVSSKKTSDALGIVKRLKPKIIITDDGFQNPSFRKDFSILVVDEGRKFQNGLPFPAGPLREYPSFAISRADLIISLSDGFRAEKFDFLGKKPPPILRAFSKPAKEYPIDVPYYAFCGLGYPKRFFDSLEKAGLNIVGRKIFPDHYEYSPADLEYLVSESSALKARLITTSKDYVKIKGKLETEIFEVETIFDNFDLFKKKIYEKIP